MSESGEISYWFFIVSQIITPAHKGTHSVFCCGCFRNALYLSSPLGKLDGMVYGLAILPAVIPSI